VRFFFSPVAAVFFPASFFSAGALAAGFFSAAPFGGMIIDFWVLRLGFLKVVYENIALGWLAE